MLGALHAALAPAHVDFELVETTESGDAELEARRALDGGIELVAVWGGGGTIAEVAGALAGTGATLAVIPGGTGNGLSSELGLPPDTLSAASLIAGSLPSRVREVDVGYANGRPFLLRAGVGAIARVDQVAKRSLKQTVGGLAYLIGALKEIGPSETVRFRVMADGRLLEAEGVTCVVANGGGVGRPTVQLGPSISMEDGVLDALVFACEDVGSLGSMIRLGRDMAQGGALVPRLSGHEVRVECDLVQPVVADGEPAGETPAEFRLRPRALRVLVPAVDPNGGSLPSC